MWHLLHMHACMHECFRISLHSWIAGKGLQLAMGLQSKSWYRTGQWMEIMVDG